jgi:SAM-dependent methyltransferase
MQCPPTPGPGLRMFTLGCRFARRMTSVVSMFSSFNIQSSSFAYAIFTSLNEFSASFEGECPVKLANWFFKDIKVRLTKNQKDRLKKRINAILTYFGYHTQFYAREVMYRKCKKIISDLNYVDMDVLEISPGCEFENLKFKSFDKVYYPEFDICEMVTDKKYDLIIADQIWEHLLWPYKATKNIVTMLNPGGCFLISTPFLIRIHDGPNDCSRWSEQGLKYFLAECGFPIEDIITDSWGNKLAVKLNLTSWVRTGYKSLANDPLFPVTVWAIAKIK